MKKKNKDLIKYLQYFVEKIRKDYDLSCVILFGSQARGDFSQHSDIDLIIVGEFREKYINRGLDIYEKFKGGYGLDLFCYTPEEFNSMFFRGVVSILDSIDEGICLYGEDFFKSYKNKLIKLKEKGLKKDPPVWILPDSMTIE